MIAKCGLPQLLYWLSVTRRGLAVLAALDLGERLGLRAPVYIIAWWPLKKLAAETGDTTHVRSLLEHGLFESGQALYGSRPLPSRSWWGALRNWIGL